MCVVVPDREQSGIGTALTLHQPVRARNVSAESFMGEVVKTDHPLSAHIVEGTPGDSCILALEQLVGKVDLVVSGINTGSNLGWDIMVSGTVGAALQGYVRGYPTIAISVGTVQNPQFDVAAQFLRLTAVRLETSPTADPFFLNVNVPSVPLEIQVVDCRGRSQRRRIRSLGWGRNNLPASVGRLIGQPSR